MLSRFAQRAGFSASRAASLTPRCCLTATRNLTPSSLATSFLNNHRLKSTTQELIPPSLTTSTLDITDEKPSPKTLMSDLSLNGKVIVVSGGAQGLGLAQAQALIEAGAIVHVLDHQPEPGPLHPYENAKTRIIGAGLPAPTYHQVDVCLAQELDAAVSSIVQKHGRLDGLIAAAGIQEELEALSYTRDKANRIFDVNVTGALLTAQAVARQMINLSIQKKKKKKEEEGNDNEKNPSGGSICLIASMSGSVANRGLICPVYNASKAGVLQLARNLAAEWGPEHNIRVNTISPGYIRTEMVEALFVQHPERRKEWPQQNMLGRLSEPGDYAGAAVFLLSDASRFMTGADLRIDGGHSAW